MAKLYVFGIGGTGSRVLKSLTFLMASGVKIPEGFDTIVPIVIDPDTANGDLNRTADILTKYQEIRKATNKGSDFFGTQIKTLKELIEPSARATQNNFKFSIGGTTNERFMDFIDYHGLSKSNKSLIDLLYTDKDLDLTMDVGFKGNPNIGSIVLNQFKKSKEYIDFANSFGPEDSIFIISSIFGGTGAAGFPLLLKNLRDNDVNVPNSNLIKEAKIGAISFLPYYKIGVPPEGVEKTIDSSSFFGKAKSALSYYEHSIFDSKQLDAFYYIGESESTNTFDHNDGKEDQENPAHFLEMAGAVSIINFMKNVKNVDRIHNPLFSEFGIHSDGSELIFSDLGSKTKEKIAKSLSKLMLFNNFLENAKDQSLSSKDTWHKAGNFGVNFYSKDFYNMEFEPFMKHFVSWMNEMAENDKSFDPFKEQSKYDDLLNFIKGSEVKNSFFKKHASADRMIDVLNKNVDNIDFETSEEHFVKLFHLATEEMVNNILK